jgi:hypothetical protein
MLVPLLNPQGNGQVKFINKVLRTLLIKLFSENKIDWDENLLTILFSYITTYKVATNCGVDFT